VNDAASVDLAVPDRALAVGAHSDDVEFGCGATLAKWTTAGCEVHLLVLTDGSKGTWDPDADLDALVSQRREEQQRAAAVLGLAAVTFLDFADGELDSGARARAQVCEVIRRSRPDVVLGHDPWARYQLHPDHRHAGLLVADGIVAARDPHFFAEQGLASHRPEALLLFEAEEPDHVERVDGFIDVKVEALLCHRSQWRSTMRIDETDPDVDAQRAAFTHRIHREAAAAGRRTHAPHAEAFKLLTDL
jgi:LmbE family N-acetylglucosaminyl deacetylase